MRSSRALPDRKHSTSADPIAGWPAALCALTRLLSGRPPPRLDEGGWRLLVHLAVDRHRVAPAVLDGVGRTETELPDKVAEALDRAARSDARAALEQKAESLRLIRALGKRGCRPALLKGWPLAEQLYGSAALRHSKDIDLYIAPDEIDMAVSVLQALGYGIDEEHEARLPQLSAPAFRAEYNDLSWRHPRLRTQVELHWRNYHFHGWPELREFPEAFVDHALDRTGESVQVLSPPANLVYLAMHGQQHLWLRLKWLLDIARLAKQRGPERLLDDLAFARRTGAARPVVLAVVLAHRVFDSPLPETWPEPDLAGRRALNRFVRMIGSEAAEPGAWLAKVEYYRTALGLAETGPQRIGVLRYLLWRRLRLGIFRGRLAPT